MAVSINSFGATLGKVAFGNAGVPKALGTIGRSALRKEGGSMATTALGRLYRRGGAYAVASTFAKRGAGGAMIGAGIGAAVGVGNQVSQNRSYGDGAMNGVFGAAIRGGLMGGAVGMGIQGGMGMRGALRQGGFARGIGPGLGGSFNWTSQAGKAMTGVHSGGIGDAAFAGRVAARAAGRTAAADAAFYGGLKGSGGAAARTGMGGVNMMGRPGLGRRAARMARRATRGFSETQSLAGERLRYSQV